MKYPILIVKNNLKKRYDFKKGLQWFKDNTPLEITVDELKTSIPLTFETKSNATYSGTAVGESVKTELRKLIPENKYKCVVFLYGDKSTGIRVSIADEIPLYRDTDFIEVIKLDDGGKVFNHELLHTFFMRLARQGIVVSDPMDSVVVNGKVQPYFNNNNLRSKLSNRTIALERLAPYWKQVCGGLENAQKSPVNDGSPLVRITRSKSSKKQTLGQLEAKNGGATFTCKALELPWLDNASNISCIPKGTYKVRWSFSPKFRRFTYEVTGVPNRSGIRIHSANYFSQIQGCIALGNGLSDINKDGELDVINSRVTITAFEGFLNKKPFTLEIV